MNETVRTWISVITSSTVAPNQPRRMESERVQDTCLVSYHNLVIVILPEYTRDHRTIVSSWGPL